MTGRLLRAARPVTTIAAHIGDRGVQIALDNGDIVEYTGSGWAWYGGGCVTLQVHFLAVRTGQNAGACVQTDESWVDHEIPDGFVLM